MTFALLTQDLDGRLQIADDVRDESFIIISEK